MLMLSWNVEFDVKMSFITQIENEKWKPLMSSQAHCLDDVCELRKKWSECERVKITIWTRNNATISELRVKCPAVAALAATTANFKS